jgi:hypothetical protein
MSLTKLSLAGIIKLFPASDSFVSDIPAGDGKNANLFYSVATCVVSVSMDIKVVVHMNEVRLPLTFLKICLKNVSTHIFLLVPKVTYSR